MVFFKFAKEIFTLRPAIALTISGLFFLAGVLELFSMAMVLPVLMGLFDSNQDMGTAGRLIEMIGFQDISFSNALIFICILMSIKGLLILCAEIIMAKFAVTLEIEARYNLFSSLINANWPYIQKQDLGKTPNLILRETERYSTAIQKLGQFVSSVLIAGILITSSVFASWQLAIIFVIAVLPYLFISRLINKRILKHAKKRVNEANSISTQTTESLMHLKYIKSSALENLVSNKFSKSIQKYASHFFKIVCYTRFIKNFPEIFGVLIIALVVIYAHNYMGIESSNIVFFLLLMFRGYRQISGVQMLLSGLMQSIPSYRICQETIKESLSQEEKINNVKNSFSTPIQLKLKNLMFSHKADENLTLDNINIDFPTKGLIAFAGSSGAGKTTLADLVLGLIHPQDGKININENLSLSDINIKEWRQKIGYVPQDPFLISGTIKENILLHSEENSDSTLLEVSKLAQVDDFVQKLPDKYDTHLGAINTALSGGQKQRIAIARALAHDPALLILDEATSALDKQTEKEICTVIKDIAKTKLVLMIAHSPDMIKQADTVYTLKNGKII